MAPFLLFFFISTAALAYGTYTDFRERIVRNYVTYGLLLAGLAGHAALSLAQADPTPFIYSMAASIAAFAFSYLLYKAGVWAGGDVKLFTGIAALNPTNPAILTRLNLANIPAFQPISIPIFFLTLFVFSLFAMLPYGAALAAAKLLKNRKEKEKFKADAKKRIAQAATVSAAAIGLSALLSLAGLSQLLVIPLLFAFAFAPKKASPIIAALLMLPALWANPSQAALDFATVLALLLGFWLLLKLYSLSKTLMRKPVKITDLEEGMISAQTIVRQGKQVRIVPETGIKKLIKYFASYKFGKAMQLLQPKGQTVVSSSRAGGLTQEEIKELKRLAEGKKIPGQLLVKESAPFVPAVLIAYIALSMVGDVIWIWSL